MLVSITTEADKHLSSIVKSENAIGIELGVKGGGCSGLTYILDLVDEPEEDDKVIEEHGLKLFVDRKSYVFLAGTILEYSGGLNGKGFVFNNPNAKTTCGCGTSFGI